MGAEGFILPVLPPIWAEPLGTTPVVWVLRGFPYGASFERSEGGLPFNVYLSVAKAYSHLGAEGCHPVTS